MSCRGSWSCYRIFRQRNKQYLHYVEGSVSSPYLVKWPLFTDQASTRLFEPSLLDPKFPGGSPGTPSGSIEAMRSSVNLTVLWWWLLPAPQHLLS